jgi:hypothetical protein
MPSLAFYDTAGNAIETRENACVFKELFAKLFQNIESKTSASLSQNCEGPAIRGYLIISG